MVVVFDVVLLLWYRLLCLFLLFVFFFKQKTAYEMRISDWSSDVCSSDLPEDADQRGRNAQRREELDQFDRRRRRGEDAAGEPHHAAEPRQHGDDRDTCP